VDWEGTGEVVSGLDKIALLLAFFIALFTSVFIGTIRLRQLLIALGCPLSFREALMIKMGSLPLNVFITGKMNHVSQIVYLKRQKQMPLLTGSFLIGFSLFLNFLVLFVIPLLITVYALITQNFVGVERLMNVGILTAVMALLSILSLTIIMSADVRSKIFNKLSSMFPACSDSFKELQLAMGLLNFKKLVFLLLYSMAFQYTAFIVFLFLVKSVGLSIPVGTIFAYLPLVIILAGIPLTLFGLGVRESLILWFFSAYAPGGAILALGLLFSLAENIIPPFFGLIFTNIYLKKLFISESGKGTA
jgi:uncharacterized membrane protein YbhN (UPF0104 family)